MSAVPENEVTREMPPVKRSFRFRRARPMEELSQDPGFAYHVGQLIGANEMAAHWMALQQDEDTQRMGEKLAETVQWFFKDVESKD